MGTNNESLFNCNWVANIETFWTNYNRHYTSLTIDENLYPKLNILTYFNCIKRALRAKCAIFTDLFL